MRKIILLIVVFFSVGFIITRFTEVQAVAETFRRGDWRWLLLAAAVHLAWMFNVAASFRALYRLLGLNETVERILLVAAAANFVNVVAPAGGMGGLAVIIADGRRRGFPSGRVTTAAVLFIVYEYISLLVMITIGLYILFQRDQLNTAEVLAASLLASLALTLIFLLAIGVHSHLALGRTLSAIGTFINRLLRPILRREALDISNAYSFAQDINHGLRRIQRAPGGLLIPGALALSSKALLVSILFLVFLAFQQPFSIGTVIAGTGVGYLFTIISPTPSGIGIVEGAMALTLRSLRVPLAAATVIALAFRGFTFWLTLFYGMFAMRWISRQD